MKVSRFELVWTKMIWEITGNGKNLKKKMNENLYNQFMFMHFIKMREFWDKKMEILPNMTWSQRQLFYWYV